MTTITIKHCWACPFQSDAPHGYCCHCDLEGTPEESRRINAWTNAPIPKWCPLRSGPTTVELASKKRGDGR